MDSFTRTTLAMHTLLSFNDVKNKHMLPLVAKFEQLVLYGRVYSEAWEVTDIDSPLNITLVV